MASQTITVMFILLSSATLCWIFVGHSFASRRVAPSIILLSGFLSLLVSRWPILEFDRVINPDEALMAANAMQEHYGWLNWNFVDTLTAGPLDSMVLSWPYVFGGDITLFSTRLTGVVLLGLALTSLYSTIGFLGNNRLAAISIVPIYTFVIATSYSDFVHYSSELLPITLISGGLYFYSISVRYNVIWPLFVAAFVLGGVPVAKLQGTPIAMAVGGFVLSRAFLTASTIIRRSVYAASIVVSASVPMLFFLVPLTLSGGFDDFIKSYFVQQSLRVAGEKWHDNVPAMLFDSFWWVFDCYGMIILLGVEAYLVTRYVKHEKSDAATRRMFFLASMLLPVSYLAISISGRPYAHYLLLSIPAIVIASGAACAAISSFFESYQAPPLRFVGLTIMVFLVTLFGGELVVYENKQTPTWKNCAFLQGAPFSAPRSLQWLRPLETDRLLCWGWSPECYVNSTMRPATREATNENQLYNTALRNYFRARFLRDIETTKPAFIVDTVAPGSFHFTDPKTAGIKAFPELQSLVNRDYQLVSSVNPSESCPRVYVIKSRAASIEASLVHFKSITVTESMPGFSPSSLDDGSVFESCRDYWLAPNSVGGSIKVQFDKPSSIKRIALMNTRNGPSGDRSTKNVSIKLMLGVRVVRSFEIHLNRFPYWTIIEFTVPVTQADAMCIDILSFEGKGGGLNELKVYRD